MPQCPHCPPGTPLDSSDCSIICTNCGLVLDTDETSIDFEPANTPHSSLLKSSRTTWNLAGQKKEATHRRNIYLINEFIKSLAHALSAPGLAPRTITLFNQAMATGQFTWGNKAKVVAGACLSIALRESHKPESLNDIGFLVQQSHTNMKRILASVISVLGITLVPSEPQQHLSALQFHLISILEPSQHSTSPLPPTLTGELKPLSIRSAEATARSLTDLLTTVHAPDLPPFAAAPTACAVFILSLEAEARATLSNLSELATFFAARCHVGKGVVMRCYKSVQDELVKWSEELNWLDAYQQSKGRAKVAKRLLVARALKDLIAWKDDVRRQQLQDSECFAVGAKLDEKDDASESYLLEIQKKDSDAFESIPSEGPPRKRKKLNHMIGDAAQFLADPLAGPIPPSTPANTHSIPDDSTLARDTSKKGPGIPDIVHHIPLTQYLLASPAPVRSVKSFPSRLQLLSVARGGSGQEEIGDEELLTDTEWDSIQRTSPEMDEILEQWRRDGTLDSMERALHQDRSDKNRKKKKGPHASCKSGSGAPKKRKTKKINFDAFAKLMDEGDSGNPELTEFLGIESLNIGEDECEESQAGLTDEDDGDEDNEGPIDSGSVAACEAEDGDVIDEWHPLSP
ncbi:hypothetical protein PQX77_004650 [Marasmius sp. AFHP31]|nr:hypothetical protein PQX77_004650 [Marasmius sp. AFHP31]